jgi:hypothetical protein
VVPYKLLRRNKKASQTHRKKLTPGISNLTTKVPISEKEDDCLGLRYIKENNPEVIK